MTQPLPEKAIFKKLPKVLMATFKGFGEDRGLKLSASLAYYTLFSIGPLFLLVLSIVSIAYGQEATEGKIFGQLNGLLGADAAKQVQEIIKNIAVSGQTTVALVIGIVTLIIGATSIFIEIQDSLNMIWKLKAKPKKGWLQFLKNRLISSSMIISLGFLMLISLIVNGVIEAMVGWLGNYFTGGVSAVLLIILNLVVTFIIVSLLFGILFKFLPDAKIEWKHVRTGAIFTAILFMIGRYLIGLYITYTATASTYGASGSIIVILVWIYYSAVILYLGAEFTQVATDALGGQIEPAPYAVHVQQMEVEKEVDKLPARHDV
ncbi:MAG: YihY/virulence factor BrkB family protein [Sphingobacteriales bacterium]|nr:MAG: YihY/virulence factor BrkB family protein [Sphingobacteriales bacterium]